MITHERPYKQARSVPDALAEMNSQRGRQFDPHLVDVLTGLIHSEGLHSEGLLALRTAVGKSAMFAFRSHPAPAIPVG